MKVSLSEALGQLPAAPTEAWPDGAPFVAMMTGGTMTLEVFAPVSRARTKTCKLRIRKTSCIWCKPAAVKSSSGTSVLRRPGATRFLCLPGSSIILKTSAVTLSPGSFFMARKAVSNTS